MGGEARPCPQPSASPHTPPPLVPARRVRAASCPHVCRWWCSRAWRPEPESCWATAVPWRRPRSGSSRGWAAVSAGEPRLRSHLGARWSATEGDGCPAWESCSPPARRVAQGARQRPAAHSGLVGDPGAPERPRGVSPAVLTGARRMRKHGPGSKGTRSAARASVPAAPGQWPGSSEAPLCYLWDGGGDHLPWDQAAAGACCSGGLPKPGKQAPSVCCWLRPSFLVRRAEAGCWRGPHWGSWG